MPHHGHRLSAFSWSYALLQIPGGIFLDRFGTRMTYSLALTLWSRVHRAHGRRSTSLPSWSLTRIGVGIFEAPCFPANSRILATWFPQQERARANSIYSVGQYAGIAFLSVPLFWVTQQFGWRGLFFLAGGFGIVLGALLWLHLSRAQRETRASAPRSSRTSRPAAAASTPARGPFSWSDIGMAAPASPDHRRVDRAVRRQLDAGVLRHLVSDLSGQRPRHELHQRRA